MSSNNEKPKFEEYKLHVTDYLDKAFPNKELPVNAIIEKGRCGIGGTYLELTNTKRKSIIVVPTIGIIEDKIDLIDEKGQLKYPDLFPIYGNITSKKIIDHLINVQPQKIIITPDSLLKFVDATKSVKGLWEQVKHDYFLLFDEFHSIITEAFRLKMIPAFEKLFEFENKSLISATPYYFSDPRMLKLDRYKISFYEKLGHVNIVNAKSVRACLNAVLTESVKMQGNVHIFYNSVTDIAEAVNYAELKDCNIYCADKPENFEKLGKAVKFHQAKPTTGMYKKFNFYTSKYFEGWDLIDENCTIILVTDIYKPHSQVGISNKGVQAIGRIRTEKDKPNSYPFAIYHITNHHFNKNIKRIEDFAKEYFFHALEEIESYNLHLHKCKKQGFEPLKERTEIVLKFAEINTLLYKAELCYTKLDQIINASTCNEMYNHIDFIKEAWQNANYTATVFEYEEVLKPKDVQRQTKLSVKEIIETFRKLEPKGVFVFNSDEMKDQLDRLITKYPNLYEAYRTMTPEEIEATNYDYKEIEKQLILKKNKDAEIRVLKLLPLYFTVGNRYTKAEIKANLQKNYNEAGFQKKATAEQLKNPEWYEVKPCKLKNKEGKYENGFEIIRQQFKLLVSTKKD